MALFFSGAVTSSPIKRRLRANHACQSLDVSLLSPDSSYVCYSSADGGDPCSYRRSPRLLTNGYYSVTEDSFTWDDDGNVSLSPCKTNVSYKENLVRVFRRRRRPRSSLARLLSDVTESCQSWLDEKVFRGVFRTGQNQNQTRDRDQDLDLDRDQHWTRNCHEGPAVLEESTWSGFNSTDLDDGRSFTYDHTEIPPPPDKVAPPPKLLIQEEICSEICQSKERFTQSLGGLSEVPPPSPFYASSCRQASPEPAGLTMKALLLFIFTVFILAALYSGCLMWSATVTSTVFIMITTFMFATKSGPMGEWRRAKTEDITSRNE
ncbi:LOW QUALITY PROTEIN: transmembrane protein 71 [Plectropomus leopardus]|uniref:LOW QUALITY PROTEIN: transmembrane protein 71 n=1 Tax=Plectropomus leopardus TaxID=160734 RepID=UPI001C4BAA05|nr:LOW QUALITY PROTEIN: transmembrane protein 71 [Plectropomus leopardus]